MNANSLIFSFNKTGRSKVKKALKFSWLVKSASYNLELSLIDSQSLDQGEVLLDR